MAKKVDLSRLQYTSAAIRTDRRDLYKSIVSESERAEKVLGMAYLITETESKAMNCVVSISNLRKSMASVKFYMDMAKMLLENVESDLNVIDASCRLFNEKKLAKDAQSNADKKALAKKMADADRIREKRNSINN